jgi:hypothetical protein
MSFSEGMAIGDYHDQLLVYNRSSNNNNGPINNNQRPYWLTPSMYWIMTMCVLSYPYRVWFSWRCPSYTMNVIKELRNVSVQEHQSPQQQQQQPQAQQAQSQLPQLPAQANAAVSSPAPVALPQLHVDIVEAPAALDGIIVA